MDELELVTKVRKLVIIALASHDKLVESIVLKGGNAIHLVLDGLFTRASYDLDYSIENGDFENVEKVSGIIETVLRQTFKEHQLNLLEFKLIERPKTQDATLSAFWGGYEIEFKVITDEQYKKNIVEGTVKNKIEKVVNEIHSKSSIKLTKGKSNAFKIDLSKHEFIGRKYVVDIDGYKIFVYAPEMIVFEKLRAICQQMEGYKGIVSSFKNKPRPKDFYDIYMLMEKSDIDVANNDAIEIIKRVFEAKRVPMGFIKEIIETREYHRIGWEDVKATVSDRELKGFDFYFDYVVGKFGGLVT